MTPPHSAQFAGRADWALMTAVHDAPRRDLDQLPHATASPVPARARWGTLRSQLRFHLGAEHAATWPRVRSKPAGDSRGQALLDALDDERQLPGPLQGMIDDAHTVDADPGRLRQLLARLRARLASHLAHEEANALPLISQILTPANSAESPKPSVAGHSIRHARTTIPWALTGADPDVREQVLSQLPAGTRPYPGPDSLAAVPRSHHPAAANDIWPGAAVTAGDTASSPLAAVSPADRMALLPGRPTEPALWALIINHADCSESGLDPDQWFPVGADHGRARQEAAAAIAICTTCPVRGHCLTLSLRRWDSGQHGVWGGLVAADRARLRRRAHPHRGRTQERAMTSLGASPRAAPDGHLKDRK